MIATRPDQLTAAWLSAALGWTVDAARFEPLPSLGMTSRTGRLWLDGAGPESLFVKLPDPALSVLPPVCHQRELDFYQQLADELDMRTLKLHHGALEDGAGVLLLEDLRDGTTLDPQRGIDAEQAAQVLTALCGLQAHTWDGPDLPWLQRWSGEPAAWAAWAGPRCQAFVDGFAEVLSPRQATLVAELIPCLEPLIEAVSALPFAVCHADLNPDNLMRTPGGEVILIDWQLLGLVPAVYDAAMVLGNGLDAETVGARDRLWAGYCSGLAARGVQAADLDRQLDLCLLFLLAVRCGAMGQRGLDAERGPWARKLLGPAGLFACIRDRGALGRLDV